MKPLGKHARAEIAHAIERGTQRHDLSLDEIIEIKEMIRASRSNPVERRSKRVCVHEVEFKSSYIYCVYDSKSHEIVTFLPAGWQPTNPVPSWRPPCAKKAYGGVVVDDQKRVLLRKVAGQYKGYHWTWPKGRPDGDEEPEQAALREVREETGHECKITGKIYDVFRGVDTETRYFIMQSVRDHGDFGKETSELRWAGLEEAEHLLGMTEHEVGRQRDLDVLSIIRRRLVKK